MVHQSALTDVADDLEQLAGLPELATAPSEPTRRSAPSAWSGPVTLRSVIAIR